MKKFISLLAFTGLLAACGDGASPDIQTESRDATQSTTLELNQVAPMKYDIAGQTDADHLFLEEVEGEKALAKVKAWNMASKPLMTENDIFKEMKAELLEIYNSPEKIPYVSYRAGKAHNFWQDSKNVRGLWRQTSLDSYQSDAPEWEAVLDIDALAKRDGKKWVYKGNNCGAPSYERCMVRLSIGGKDAVERREFDVPSKTFVKDGFHLPESKGGTAWLDADNLLVGVDFGAGTMTDSGYPLVNKLWTRGTPLTQAKELLRGEKTDVGLWPATFENANGGEEILLIRAVTFYETEYYWMKKTDSGFEKIRVPVPVKSSLGDYFKGQQLVTLQQDWRGHKTGTVLSFAIDDFMSDGKIDTLHTVIAPGARQSIGSLSASKSKLLLSLYDNVAASAYALDFDGTRWSKIKLDFPENGAISIGSTNSKEDIAFINSESFLQPDTLWTIDTSSGEITKSKSKPSWFDSSTMVAEQHHVASSDGTKIPYFIVRAKDAVMNGDNPTLLYGYGGFEVPINPSYSATIGRAWLARGGVYVVANMRGGGEFGPDWHQAGLKTKRQLIYDDFIAVAEDLIARKITKPARLGIHGRSNGGLLMGVMFTQRPDLFGAIACGVPLLDMMRYHKLLAGASWMGEYGDPDDGGAEAAFLRSISPYHNILPDVKYPKMYIYTSTKDDRVHPAHARKMAQRLEDMGHEFFYYENIDGGHAGAANLEETAHSQALIYSYLAGQLMDPQ